jgi:hypothetical protein
MFIRWQEYKSIARWHPDRPIKRVKAILVESVRVDGKPRHKHIAFVSSYQPDLGDRFRFWREARECLDHLGGRITPECRTKIETALAKRVPPTSPEEEAQRERDLAERWDRFKQSRA